MNRDLISWITFISVFSIIIFAINFYIGYRLTWLFPAGSPWKVVVWSVIVACALMVMVSPFMRIFGSKVFELASRKLVFVGYSYLGFMTLLFFILVILDVFFFISTKAISNQSFSEERRALLFGYGPWAAAGLTAALSVKGFQTAFRGPDVVPVAIKKKNLPSSLQGLKIAQISDLHVSSTIRKDYVEAVVAKTMAEKPDIIVLTGDMVDGSYEDLKVDVDPLRKLSAPMGIYYITGNHEYYWGHENWGKVFVDFGFKVLHNQHIVIEKNGAKVVVAGVPDFTVESFKVGKVDAELALTGVPMDAFRIFLVHQPEGYKLLDKAAVKILGKDSTENICDLQLSGHTHAGQFFPASLFIGLFHKYARGLYLHEDKFWIYVNPGTGYWGPTNRLGVPSEITLFTLQS